MTIEFRLPELGENITAGDVVGILVAVGDTVKPEQAVLEIETDKATIELPCPDGGTIQQIHVSVGDKVQVGQLILTLGEVGATLPQPQPAPKEPAKPEAPPPRVASAQEISPTGDAKAEFRLPELGENITSGQVVGILVSVGDTIAPEQAVLEIETDKATAEVPCPVGGVVAAIHIGVGDQVQVGQLIITLKAQATIPTKVRREAEPTVPSPTVPPTPTAQPQLPSPERPISTKIDPARSAVPATPGVRRLAREIGVDVVEVAGSGPGGRLTKDDVKRYSRQLHAGDALATPSAVAATAKPLPDFSRWGQVEREAMSNIRRATAEHLSHSWAAPHVTQFDQADIEELEQLRRRFAPKVEAVGAKLTMTAIILKVLASALKRFPKFNASVDMDAHEIVYKKYYHIGVAVDTDRGLLVPVVRDVDQKSIVELSQELGQIAAKARDKKLSLEEMQGGTFTLSNLGGIGGTNFTPIINWPEVAILGVARGQVQPLYRGGQFEPRLMLPLSLSYDHRLIDGADGARFLRWVVEALEEPFLLSLEGG
jgi:pyruvate dehydrogenase E2 component (dihydrolipoamide acetyltransferase)